MFITDKICFVHLPRTGGSFTRHCLAALTDGHEDRRRPGAHNYPVKKLDQYTFGFIRNPFDWYVSWWSHMSRQQTLRNKPYKDCYSDDFNKFLNKFINKRDLKLTLRYGWLGHVDFKELYDRDMGVLTYLFEKMFRFNDKIFLFENLRSELVNVLTEFHGAGDYSMVWNHNPLKKTTRGSWKEYYTPKSLDLVRRKDKKIFDFYEEMGSII